MRSSLERQYGGMLGTSLASLVSLTLALGGGSVAEQNMAVKMLAWKAFHAALHT